MLTRQLFLLVMLAPTLGCSASEAPKPTHPRQVLLIRHAEKPDDERETGLSPVGRKRAAALPDLFRKSDSRPDPLPAPDFIIAAAPSKHSNRSAETVTPLANSLELNVHLRFASEEYRDLAALLLSDRRYEGKTVLVCWHHGTLPELAAALKARDVPERWKDAVFDRVWVITYESGEGKLARRPQSLLPGD